MSDPEFKQIESCELLQRGTLYNFVHGKTRKVKRYKGKVGTITHKTNTEIKNYNRCVDEWNQALSNLRKTAIKMKHQEDKLRGYKILYCHRELRKSAMELYFNEK